MPGEHYVSVAGQEMIVTLLGSCVTACIWDTARKIGGMNHFMLPESSNGSPSDNPLRFGRAAMDKLLEDLFRRGARNQTIEVQLFGGGNVVDALTNSFAVGDRNAQFVRQYAREKGLKVTVESLGGTLPRQVHFFPRTGRTATQLLRRDGSGLPAGDDSEYRARLAQLARHSQEA